MFVFVVELEKQTHTYSYVWHIKLLIYITLQSCIQIYRFLNIFNLPFSHKHLLKILLIGIICLNFFFFFFGPWGIIRKACVPMYVVSEGAKMNIFLESEKIMLVLKVWDTIKCYALKCTNKNNRRKYYNRVLYNLEGLS